MFFFFFQAEDGIRDYKVTGVQTCALPIWAERPGLHHRRPVGGKRRPGIELPDRKSTRLNSSHLVISYAVFCLKKKKNLRPPARATSRPFSICPPCCSPPFQYHTRSFTAPR